MNLTSLQLVPLTKQQWEQASKEGRAWMLTHMEWEHQPKTFGRSSIHPATSRAEVPSEEGRADDVSNMCSSLSQPTRQVQG